MGDREEEEWTNKPEGDEPDIVVSMVQIDAEASSKDDPAQKASGPVWKGKESSEVRNFEEIIQETQASDTKKHTEAKKPAAKRHDKPAKRTDATRTNNIYDALSDGDSDEEDAEEEKKDKTPGSGQFFSLGKPGITTN